MRELRVAPLLTLIASVSYVQIELPTAAQRLDSQARAPREIHFEPTFWPLAKDGFQ